MGTVHLEELDIGSGSNLDHRLRAHNRSRESADGPLELGPLARRILRSEGLIDQLAAECIRQERFCGFDVGHRDADMIDAANDGCGHDILLCYLFALSRGVTKEQWLSFTRSEERRVGKECVSTCGSRWSRVP